LDLLTLLAAPLAFTLFDWEDKDGRPVMDPLALLEALRRHADSLVIFCQAGQIKLPPRDQRLLAYVEHSVFEVAAPTPHGLFHPKVWVLRFTTREGPVRYRVLCLSRNLTFDRSWDTVLSLEGELAERKNSFASNRQLAAFVAALPGLVIRPPLPDRARKVIETFQDELLRVRFELPEGFDQLAFWPLGIPDMPRWPFAGRIDRLLVVSPFLAATTLKRLAKEGTGHILVSRTEELASLSGPTLKPFQIYTLSAAANGDPLDEDAPPASMPESTEDSLVGLHAKLYVADAGWEARVWTGSANATEAAFERNVEFLIELTGKKSQCGIDAFLGTGKDGKGVLALLEPFSPAETPTALDPIQQQMEHLLDEARRALAAASLSARVTPDQGGGRYHLTIERGQGPPPTMPAGITMRAWPVTLRAAAAASVQPDADPVADLGLVSFEALTSFFAFELVLSYEGRTSTLVFVLNLPLVGAPEDRPQRVLLSLLGDRQKLLRFLLLLLAGTALDVASLVGPTAPNQPGSAASNGLENTLLESFIRALDQSPDKLDQVARLVADLRQTPDGQRLLPDGFESVWEPIWAARQRRKS
jgi:hypothetical protein